MKNNFTEFLIATILLFSYKTSAQVTITDSATASQLVQTLVGSGVSYSNATIKCKANAEGIFNVATSNLGLTGGIILTTGNAEGASALSSLGSDACNESGETNNLSDSSLASLVTVSIHDACVVEFDFVPDGDSLLFDYVFGSEEYHYYSCSQYNDVFGFFLSGPGITGTPNIALIPGTNIPVSINSTTDPTITMPSSLTLCQAMGPGSPFAQYYNDNQTMTTIKYYGLTKVLTARAGVIPCNTYHIKLAIGDGYDCALSSGVFLAANSFRSNYITLDLQSTLDSMNYLVEGCSQGTLKVSRSNALPTPQTVKLSYTGSATLGTDYNTLPDSVIIPANGTSVTFAILPNQDNTIEGTEYIVINTLNKCTDAVTDSLVIPIYETLLATLISDDTFMCGSQPVRLEVSGDNRFTYRWSSVPYSKIDGTTAQLTYGYPDSTTIYTVKAQYKSCYSDAFSFKALVEPIPVVEILNPQKEICLGLPLQLLAHVGPDYYQEYNYQWSPPTGLSNTTILEPQFFVTDAGIYTMTLTATTATLGCADSASISFDVKPAAHLTDVTPEFTLKYGESMRLNASGVIIYTWSPTSQLDNPNINNPVVIAQEPTIFTVVGFNEYGCADTAYVKMNVDYHMTEMIPNAFSPNGDGRNDVFTVRNLKYQKLIEFRVYNRFGNEVFSTVDPNQGWDGTYEGVPQEIGVYNYIVRLVIPDGSQKVYKGSVTLLR
jgi:gliding motility-associated-like protein